MRERRRAPDAGTSHDVAGAALDPELALLKRQSAATFERAYVHVLGTIDAETRTTLRLYFVDRLTFEQLGRALACSRATAARRVDRARRPRRSHRRRRQGRGAAPPPMDSPQPSRKAYHERFREKGRPAARQGGGGCGARRRDAAKQGKKMRAGSLNLEASPPRRKRERDRERNVSSQTMHLTSSKEDS